MKALLIPNLSKKDCVDCTGKIITQLNKVGIIPMICSLYREFFAHYNVVIGELGPLLDECDLLISIGGDGTIIHTAKHALSVNKPVLGVNLGRIGFLAQIEPDEIHRFEALSKGDFTIQKRMVLEVQTHGKTYHAINDVVLSNGRGAAMIDIDILCNNKFITSYRADGVIFATPTGSTAYSMSAGGPIVDYEIDTIIMNPICPYAMMDRAILFSPDKVLSAQGKELYLNIDGEEPFSVSSVIIKKSDIYAEFINLLGQNFYETLNKKL